MSTVDKFDQIVIPRFKTKSAIWKHFGFPADDIGLLEFFWSVIMLARLQTRSPFVDFAGLLSPSVVSRSGTTCTPATGQWRSAWTKQRLCGEDVDTAYNQRNTRQINPIFERKCEAQAASRRYCKFHLPRLVAFKRSGWTAFRRLLEIAEPRFKLPHCTYFTGTVIPAKYHATRAVIENQLAAVENCTVTLYSYHYYYRDIIMIKSYKPTNIEIQIFLYHGNTNMNSFTHTWRPEGKCTLTVWGTLGHRAGQLRRSGRDIK